MLSSRYHSWIYIIMLIGGFALGVFTALTYFSLNLETLNEAKAHETIIIFFSGAGVALTFSWLWCRLPSACMHCKKPCLSFHRVGDLIYSCNHCHQEWDSRISTNYERLGD